MLHGCTIGDGALIASGSVITEDVPADALAFGRARQTVKPEAAAAFLRDFVDAGRDAAEAKASPTPWAHLDIAGVASDEGKRGMATGRPVGLLCQWLLDRAH